jgi:hypothetical protein
MTHVVEVGRATKSPTRSGTFLMAKFRTTPPFALVVLMIVESNITEFDGKSAGFASCCGSVKMSSGSETADKPNPYSSVGKAAPPVTYANGAPPVRLNVGESSEESRVSHAPRNMAGRRSSKTDRSNSRFCFILVSVHHTVVQSS